MAAAHDPYGSPTYRGAAGGDRRLPPAPAARWSAATAAIFVAAIIGFGNVQQQFFPISERPELFLQIKLPEGSSITATTKAVEEAEALLKGDADVEHATAYVGQGSVRFWLGLNPQLPNPSFAEIVILSKDTEARERIKARLEQAVADGALERGAGAGRPLQLRAAGRASGAVPRRRQGPAGGAADRRRGARRDGARTRTCAIRTCSGTRWRRRSGWWWTRTARGRSGWRRRTSPQTLQTLVSGLPVTEMRDGTDLVQVVARAVPGERLDVAGLGDLTVASRDGVAVPLAQVARIEPVAEEPILWRRNRELMISVRADIRDGVQAPDVTSAILPALAPIKAALPAGYRIETGGAIEESEKGNSSIFKMFPIMLVVTLTLLMIQLQSFARVGIVLLTAPLGIIGASLALNLFGAPFGFVALLGLIALMGMIMRNSVILVDQIEADVTAGLPRRRAIVEATVRRARPVVLTALAAILAMIPLSRSVFWGPMAMVIMGGLMVATLLTLFFLPALYALCYRVPSDDDVVDRSEKDEPSVLALAAE